VPDVREEPKPDWISDPFEGKRPRGRKRLEYCPDKIRVLCALAQRGKGGVYEAIDLRGGFPEPCLLKEGRRNGEVTWDGRDGAWRIRNEERVLARLSAAGVNVPAVRCSFALAGNYYLVMEYLEGETLHNFLSRLHRRLSLSRVVQYSLQLAMFLSQMHRAGWVWRDCKPKNLIVTKQGPWFRLISKAQRALISPIFWDGERAHLCLPSRAAVGRRPEKETICTPWAR